MLPLAGFLLENNSKVYQSIACCYIVQTIVIHFDLKCQIGLFAHIFVFSPRLIISLDISISSHDMGKESFLRKAFYL